MCFSLSFRLPFYDRNADCIEEQCPFYITENETKSERFAIVVEPEMMPKKDPKRTCKCMNEPVKLSTKKGVLTWIKEVGDQVKAGEVICEGEVEKKIIEFTVGKWAEKFYDDLQRKASNLDPNNLDELAKLYKYSESSRILCAENKGPRGVQSINKFVKNELS